MFWGVQIGATDRPTEMDCWSNDSNALTKGGFLLLAKPLLQFGSGVCAFPYVMMRVRKSPSTTSLYVCVLVPQKPYYLPKMDEKKNNCPKDCVLDKFIDFLLANILLHSSFLVI